MASCRARCAVGGRPTRRAVANETASEEAGPDGAFTFSFPAGVTADSPTNITYILTGTAKENIDYNYKNMLLNFAYECSDYKGPYQA